MTHYATSHVMPTEKVALAGLPDAARKAMSGHSQSDVARELDLHRSTISNALNTDDPSRHRATLERIVKRYADVEGPVYIITTR